MHNPPPRLDYLRQIELSCSDNREKYLGLLIVDIRNFTRINTVFGFEIGNHLLDALYDRLESGGIRDAEVTRLGNDEFGVLLKNLKDPQLLSLAANKVVRLLADPFELQGRHLRIEVNIGLAAIKTDAPDAQRLFQSAEASLRKAQESCRSYIPYSPNDLVETHDWDFESQLLQAVESNELELYYQPKVNLQTRRPSLCEALGRWSHPEWGIVSPGRFVPVLEQTGAINEYTKWAVHTALRQLTEWPEQFAPYNVSVNVSASVLEDDEFPGLVASALSIWGVPASSLTLEVTEGAIVQEESSSYQSLLRLQQLGLKIAIDDFGTGYSCLSYFKTIPADELKIDRSFILNIHAHKEDQMLVKVMLDLGRVFNHIVVAEGIEDKETLELLTQMGCDYAQGFVIAKPMPQSEYIEWLKHYKA